MSEVIQYFKIKEEKHQYLGNRYFKVNWDADKVIQVCITTGEIKEGKSNTFGIYLISKQTFVSNYLAMSHVIPCDIEEYKLNFKNTVKYLR